MLRKKEPADEIDDADGEYDLELTEPDLASDSKNGGDVDLQAVREEDKEVGIKDEYTEFAELFVPDEMEFVDFVKSRPSLNEVEYGTDVFGLSLNIEEA
jgi:hypothetical protein